MSQRRRVWPLPLVSLVIGLSALTDARQPFVLFRDITHEAGIAFTHHSAPEKKFIVESMSGGVALVDIDQDGLPDLYLVDSLTVANAGDATASRSALYKNLGGGRFEDVTERAGVAHVGWGMGVCAADVDGDGREDLYVTAIGGNHLFRNNGDGTFTDIAEKAGVAGGGWSTGCGFADYDRDGRLDLFVSRYVKIDLANLPAFGAGKTCEYRGIQVQCGPRGLPGETDLLFHNDGNGHFSEAGEKAGVSDPRGYFGLGIAWLDVNDDGWADLYVANDSTPNALYVNQKNGTFKDMAFQLGAAVSEDGAEQGSMGIAVGAYDNGARPSLFVTNFSEEYNALYRAVGDRFMDASFPSRTAPSSLPYVGWGTEFFDYDNDGLPDLIVGNGHVYPQLDAARRGASAGYRQRRLLYHNRGDGTFDEVAAQFGSVLMEDRVSRGLAIGDLDNDGRVDVVINDLDGPPQVVKNELTPVGHWLIVSLAGKAPNTDAIGAVIALRANGITQTRYVRSGTSYLSQSDMRQHFGLGSASSVEAFVVRWPDGTHSTLSGVPADQVLRVRQP
jgi:hypothetical protein